MDTNKIEILSEIKDFLEGYNDELKYLVNVETDSRDNHAKCIIHEPGKKPKIVEIRYESFIYMKDLKKHNLELFGHRPDILPDKMKQFGIRIVELETGNQKRLTDGFCYKITSYRSYHDLLEFLKEGRVYPYAKLLDDEGKPILDDHNKPSYPYRDLFYSLKTTEQFMLYNKCRLYKGIEEYKDVHKVTFDIETQGLRHQIARIFAIGIRDNRGFETILEVEKLNDNDSEIKLITEFFKTIVELKPAIVSGYNSEMFDFEFIIGRAKILGLDLTQIETTLCETDYVKRKLNTSVKYGNTSDKYTATDIWGISVIDILHAVKKTAAVNTEIKENKLKYIAKFEKIAKPNRTYIAGEGNNIYNFYADNKIFLVNDKNEYVKIPDKHQDVAFHLISLQANKELLTDEEYRLVKKTCLDKDKDFIDWYKKEAQPNNMTVFITGKKLTKQYLLDDLWETEKIDELYNQSSFMLAKIVPTTYQRICTMGTAGVWNLLLTAWSYENDLAIPDSDIWERFSGGLARCYKTGYSEKWVKIDYASLYPMLQLTDNIFPIFDITGVIHKMLLYLTTTRNIYKKLANSDNLNEEEIYILKAIDHDTYNKFINNKITSEDRAMFKIKQLPIKILNNSLFGALGANIAFNWSDNVCAARITCTGRLELRHAIAWFSNYDCVALLSVTDGVNFQIPNKTKIVLGQNKNEKDIQSDVDINIEDAWKYNGKSGIVALVEKFNVEEMKAPFMAVDLDGEFLSCLNLARINYASLSLVKDKKTGNMVEKIKLTGNTIKSKVMAEYIEEFIDKGFELILHGDGVGFVNYYQDYASKIYNHEIPLRKIASKNRVKVTLGAYKKRGNNINGKPKSKQAHMELLIEKRDAMVLDLFEKHKHEILYTKDEDKLTVDDKFKLIGNYMPPEPELDSMIYHVNTGYKKSDSGTNKIIDKNTGLERFASMIVTSDELKDNPDIIAEYNVAKYLSAFNNKVKTILTGFDPDIAAKILSKIKKTSKEDDLGNKIKQEELEQSSFISKQLELKSFDKDDLEESMYLEEMEVDFWNKTGFDPRLTWDGFKVHDSYPIYYEVYDNALKYLNDKMIESGRKQTIKSINSKYVEGDLVLLKKGNVFSVGLYNGTYIKIIKEGVDVPKSEAELEIERKLALELEKIQTLATSISKKSEDEIVADKMAEQINARRVKYLSGFLEKHGLSTNISIEDFMNIDNAVEAFDDYIEAQELIIENAVAEYVVDDVDY